MIDVTEKSKFPVLQVIEGQVKVTMQSGQLHLDEPLSIDKPIKKPVKRQPPCTASEEPVNI
jgi:hypothetical protein